MIKEYLLDSAIAFSFFKENLFQLNELSNEVIRLLEVKKGTFHAFLPDNVSSNKIHDFHVGGKTASLRKEVGFKLSNLINSNPCLSCIFDDFNSNVNFVSDNDLYQLHGVHFQNEIYYQIHFGANEELVLKCLNYSSTIWHSLCVVFKNDLNIDKEMDVSVFKMICKNALFIMIKAYDSESYIYWCDSAGHEILKNI